MKRVTPIAMLCAAVAAAIAAAIGVPLFNGHGGRPVGESAPSHAPVIREDERLVRILPIPAPGRQATPIATVVLPAGYFLPAHKHWRYPVVYFLHGLHGDNDSARWMMRASGGPLTSLASQYNLIIVCPEGKDDSWWLNAAPHTPDCANWQWETYVTENVRRAVERRFRTWTDRRGRGISGFSMGGHGALLLAARHTDLYSAVTSISGVMDLLRHPDDWNLKERLGVMIYHTRWWSRHSAFSMADRFRRPGTAVRLGCGYSDPFLPENRAMHRQLLALGIPHEYVERPGGHEFSYWQSGVPHHLKFLRNHLRPAGPG